MDARILVEQKFFSIIWIFPIVWQRLTPWDQTSRFCETFSGDGNYLPPSQITILIFIDWDEIWQSIYWYDRVTENRKKKCKPSISTPNFGSTYSSTEKLQEAEFLPVTLIVYCPIVASSASRNVPWWMILPLLKMISSNTWREIISTQVRDYKVFTKIEYNFKAVIVHRRNFKKKH